MTDRTQRGFTLVEVLVALVVVAIGLAALMMAVSGTARTSGYLRDKTLAQWIALNRLTEVRLTVNKMAQNTTSVGGSAGAPVSSSSSGDTGELQFAGRTWHYDTRYFETTFQSTKRIVVRVWAGDAKTKGNPIAEATGFYGSALSIPGNSNALDWTQGTTAPCQPQVAGAGGAGPVGSSVGNCTPASGNGAVVTPAPTSATAVP